MIKRVLVLSLFVFFFSQIAYSICHADNADVIPKGIIKASVNGKFYRPIDERFDDNGDEEPIAADFNATLGSNVFPALGSLETALGLPAGSANIGESIVSFEWEPNTFDFLFQYRNLLRVFSLLLPP